MNALVTSYLVVWGAALLYMVRLGANQQNLGRRVMELERKLSEQQSSEAGPPRELQPDHARAA